MVVSVLLKIEFGHTQISVPKIGIPMLKTACVNPCFIVNLFLICFFYFLDFCLHNFKFDVSSPEFVREDGEIIVRISPFSQPL